MRDLDDEVFIPVVLQLHDDRVISVVHIIESSSAMLVERAGSDNAGDLRTRHSEAMPPSARGVAIDERTDDVRERNFYPALERPELVQPNDLKDRGIAYERYFDQVCNPRLGDGQKTCSGLRVAVQATWRERNLSPGRARAVSGLSLHFDDEILHVARTDARDPRHLCE